jgi:hypothetical protein
MDTSRMSQGQMVAAAGGVVLVIALFLDWESGLGDAFDVYSGMDIIMLIIAIIAIVWGVSAGLAAVTVPALSGLLVGLLGMIALGWALGSDLEDPSAGFGAWLGLVAAMAIAWGGLGAPRRTAAVSSRSPAAPPPAAPAA